MSVLKMWTVNQGCFGQTDSQADRQPINLFSKSLRNPASRNWSKLYFYSLCFTSTPLQQNGDAPCQYPGTSRVFTLSSSGFIFMLCMEYCFWMLVVRTPWSWFFIISSHFCWWSSHWAWGKCTLILLQTSRHVGTYYYLVDVFLTLLAVCNSPWFKHNENGCTRFLFASFLCSLPWMWITVLT